MVKGGVTRPVSLADYGAALEAGATPEGADDSGMVQMAKDGSMRPVALADVPAALEAGADFAAPASLEDPSGIQERAWDGATRAPGEPPPRPTTVGEDLQAMAEGAATAPFLGAETPMRYARAGAEWLAGKAAEAGGAQPYTFDQALGDVARDMEEHKRNSPISHTVGQVGGTLLTALATGGGSALARGAGATPLGLVTRAGQAVGKQAVAAAAPKVGLLLASGAGLLAQGATEGITYGVAQEIDKAIRAGDYEGLAEKALAGAKIGAQTGGLVSLGAGAALGTLGRLLRGTGKGAAWALRKIGVLDDTVDDVVPPPAPSVTQVLDEAAAADEQVMQGAGMRPRAQIEGELHMQPTDQERSEAIKVLQRMGKQASAKKDFEQLKETAILNVSDKLNQVARTIQNQASKYLGRDKKIVAIKDALELETPVWSPEMAGRALDQVKQIQAHAEDLIKLPHVQGQASQLRALQRTIEGAKAAEKHLTGVMATGPISPESRVLRGDLDSMAETFSTLDFLKTAVGRAQHLAGKNAGNITTAEAELQRLYMGLRNHLEDPGVWGQRLSDMQRVTNAVESDAIRTGRVFETRFVKPEELRNERAGEHGFDELAELDEGKLDGFFQQLGAAKNRSAERDFLVGMERMVDLMETKANFYRVGPELHAAIGEARKMVGESASTIRTLKATKELANEYADQLERIKSIPFVGETMAKIRLSSSSALDASGLTSAGPAQSVTSAAKAQSKVNAATKIKGLIEKTERGARKAVRAAPAAGDAVRRVITLDQVDEELDAIERQSDPNSQEAQDLGAMLMDIEAEAGTEMARALALKLQQRNAFLLEKAGPRPVDAFGMPTQRDPATRANVASYMDAADDPIAAVERVAEGDGRPEDVETLLALAPRLYAEFAGKAMDHLRQQDTTRDQRVAISLELGVPMDTAMRPENIAWAQSLWDVPVIDQQTSAAMQMAPSGMQAAVPPSKVSTSSPYPAEQGLAARSDQLQNIG